MKFSSVYLELRSQGGLCKPSELMKAEEPLVLMGVGLSDLSPKESGADYLNVLVLF